MFMNQVAAIVSGTNRALMRPGHEILSDLDGLLAQFQELEKDEPISDRVVTSKTLDCHKTQRKNIFSSA